MMPRISRGPKPTTPASSAAVAVAVTARLRPAQPHTSVEVTPSGLTVENGKSFDRFLSSVVQGSDQATAHAALGGQLLDRLRAGYNVTLLAYGQTGAAPPGPGPLGRRLTPSL